MSADSTRQRIAELARAEVGTPREKYMLAELGELAEVSWCGLFALWIYHAAGLAAAVRWILMRGFALPAKLRPYSATGREKPRVGDLAYFDKEQHHAIVLGYDPATDRVELANGNSWDPELSPELIKDTGRGDVVAISTRPRREVAVFYSIDKWVPDAA